MRPSALSKFRWPLLALACTAPLYAFSPQSSEPIDPAGALQIFCPGNIKFRGTSSSRLTWRAGSDSRISFTRQGNLTILQAPAADSLEVTAPRTLERLNIHTPGGDLDVADLNGSLVAQAAGRIALGRIGGSVEIHSAGGPTSLGSIGGEIHCSSGGGAIRADTLHSGAVFQTAGGDIVIQKSTGPVRAWTGGGSIFATFFPGLMLMDSMLSTAAGDITVHLASNLHVSIRAQNTGSADRRSIVSDFSAIRVRSVRSSVLAEGAINGGGPLLRISANGGFIYIRKK